MRKLGLSKILALVLCMVLLLSFAPTMTFAVNSLVLTAAPDIYPGGPGVGFVDNPDGGGSVRGLEVSGQSIILRQNEWAKYDLSALDPGVY